MKTRVITAVVGIAVLLGVMCFYDTVVFNLIIAAVCLVGINEVFNAFKFGKQNLYLYLGFIPPVVLIFLSDYEAVRPFVLPVVYLFVLYTAICVIVKFNTLEFAKVAGMVMLSALVTLCFFSLVHLKALLPRDVYGYDAVYFVSLILGFAWGGDTAAYFVGRAFGKHKLAPVVSPKKTVEGAIGGVFGSVIISVLFTFIYIKMYGGLLAMDTVKIGYYVAIAVIGAFASVLGMLGDLLASSVKRQCDIKDYGTIFPGHGGILDRFDSLIFVAPLVMMSVSLLRAFY